MRAAVTPVLIALACGLLLSLTDRQTRSTIAENRDYHEQAALRELAPGHDILETGNGWLLEREGQPVGRIREAITRQGYNGTIRLLIATSDTQILGARVTEHRETPGLGDVIDDPEWMSQFAGMALSDDWRLSPDALDGITGATITARATISVIRDHLVELDDGQTDE